jgi:hypothetical protein
MTKRTNKMRHPPFFSGTGDAPARDYLTKDGAQALAAKIRAAWAQVGYFVDPVVVEVAPGRDRRALFGVRMPELVNGLVKAP